MSAAGWRHAAMAVRSEEARFGVIAAMLARDFPRFSFGICRMRDHIAIAAVRDGSPSRPGLYAVVTDDIGELRAALEDSG